MGRAGQTTGSARASRYTSNASGVVVNFGTYRRD